MNCGATLSADNIVHSSVDENESLRKQLDTVTAQRDIYKRAVEFYASYWGQHQGSPIKAVNKFTQNRLNETTDVARSALEEADKVGK